MKNRMKVDKANLLPALVRVARAAAKKSAIEATAGALFRAKGAKCSITGYNLTWGVATAVELLEPVDEEFTFAVPAVMLLGFVKAFDDAPIIFELKNKDTAVIKCGATRMAMQVISVDEFPALPKLDSEKVTYTCNSKKLAAAIVGTSYAVSAVENANNPAMDGFYVQTNGRDWEVSTCDGYRFAARNWTDGNAEASDTMKGVTIAGICVKEALPLAKAAGHNDPAHISFDERHVVIRIGQTSVIGRRISFEKVLTKDKVVPAATTFAEVEAENLSAAVARVALVARQSSNISAPIVMRLTNDSIHLEAKSSIGTANDECPAVSVSPEIRNLQIGLNPNYIMDACLHSGTGLIQIAMTTPVKPVVIRPVHDEQEDADADVDFTNMVLPVRIHKE